MLIHNDRPGGQWLFWGYDNDEAIVGLVFIVTIDVHKSMNHNSNDINI